MHNNDNDNERDVEHCSTQRTCVIDQTTILF
jgi:hypothetical protein